MTMALEKRLNHRATWPIGDNCSAARALDVLSTKTVLMIVRECFYGTRRFEDFVQRVDASAPAISRALKQLETTEILVRVPYQETRKRTHDEYQLTQKGEDLLPVLLALVQWGDKYLQDGHPPLSFVEQQTGRRLRVRVTTEARERSLRSDDIAVRLNSKRR